MRGRHNRGDWQMLGYYTATLMTGFLGIPRPPAVQFAGSDLAWLACCLIYVVLSFLGMIARWSDDREAEAYVIYGLCVATTVNGVLYLLAGNWVGGVRLFWAWALMEQYARLRQRTVISLRDIEARNRGKHDHQ